MTHRTPDRVVHRVTGDGRCQRPLHIIWRDLIAVRKAGDAARGRHVEQDAARDHRWRVLHTVDLPAEIVKDRPCLVPAVDAAMRLHVGKPVKMGTDVR